MDFKLTHARHDPMHCLAPGLFRSLKRGERKKSKLDITYHYGLDTHVRFVGFEPLGADDMRLLQGLVALAGPEGVLLSPNPSASIPRQLRLELAPKSDALHSDGLVVHHQLTRLLREVGWHHSGANLRTVKASLVRMSNVTVIIERRSRQASFHLMSHVFDENDGSLFVCLNPQLAEAVLGHRPHSRIYLDEVRGLSTDPARLMHQRLCGWIDPGKHGRVELDTLCGYIWPESGTSAAMRKRRQFARQAIEQLRSIGWMCEEYSNRKWLIRRPERAVKDRGGKRVSAVTFTGQCSNVHEPVQ